MVGGARSLDGQCPDPGLTLENFTREENQFGDNCDLF